MMQAITEQINEISKDISRIEKLKTLAKSRRDTNYGFMSKADPIADYNAYSSLVECAKEENILIEALDILLHNRMSEFRQLKGEI